MFLTARAEAADRRLGAQLGGVGYVVKPFDPVLIGDFVEDVIERVERGEPEELTRDIASPRAMSTPQTHDADDRALRLQRVAEPLAEVVTPRECSTRS